MGSFAKYRTKQFKWDSRLELYTYFKDHYGLDRKIIDREIDIVMNRFSHRIGESIKTQELWEKVGSHLEKTFGYMKITDGKFDIILSESIIKTETIDFSKGEIVIHSK